jgi:hypothetical protein
MHEGNTEENHCKVVIKLNIHGSAGNRLVLNIGEALLRPHPPLSKACLFEYRGGNFKEIELSQLS